MNAGRKPVRYHRRSVRLKHFDYTQAGMYFVTICTYGKKWLFGKSGNTSTTQPAPVKLSRYGKIASEEWLKSSVIRDEIELDEYIILPNHVHGIIVIRETPLNVQKPKTKFEGDQPVAPTARLQTHSLGSLIAGYKSAVTRRINEIRHTPGQPVWQRSYYEHIIRNEEDLNNIREYIRFNPAKLEQYR